MENCGKNEEKKTKKRLPVWIIAVIDVIAAGIFLCVFAYFHHVNPIGVEDDDPIIIDPVISAEPIESQAPDIGVFLREGQAPQKTDTSYISQNVRVEVRTEKTGDNDCHIAEIWVRDVKYLKTGFSGGDYKNSWKKRVYIDELAPELGAFVAVNGDQCKAHREGIVVRNGVLYRQKGFKDIAVLHYDGTLETVFESDVSAEKIKSEGAWQVWSFGPALLKNSAPMTDFNAESYIKKQNPRTAIGMIEPNHFVLVAVDGRKTSRGMTLTELSEYMHGLGCKTAYNLDGGDTSSMYLNGKTYSTPSGRREVTDVIYISEE